MAAQSLQSPPQGLCRPSGGWAGGVIARAMEGTTSSSAGRVAPHALLRIVCAASIVRQILYYL
eukprot:1823901-Pyramimonas_sp.AAC.1